MKGEIPHSAKHYSKRSQQIKTKMKTQNKADKLFSVDKKHSFAVTFVFAT